ncbi:hypothetical protein [Roseomonas elaeocarpi]|uniref:Uncharacterized protein n=1 Tax=Roseomonas elaeocarpi TaxID=907779 RepID=A0ABV6JRD8_9PROT
MSGALTPAIRAELTIVGAELTMYLRFMVGDGVRARLVFTDRETGAPYPAPQGIWALVTNAQGPQRTLGVEDMDPDGDGAWVFDIAGDTPCTWRVFGGCTGPRQASADPLVFEIVC